MEVSTYPVISVFLYLTKLCSSTGVQIGGFASAMGVVGIWTTTSHDHGMWNVILTFLF